MLSQTRKEQCILPVRAVPVFGHKGRGENRKGRGAVPGPVPGAFRILPIPPEKLAIVATVETGFFHDNWGAEKQVGET